MYKAEVKAADSTVTYLGAAANTFKERFRNHTLSFKHEKYKQNTSLSKHIWDLKTDQKPFEIKWSIAGRATPYNPTAKSCKLCLLEKTLILTTADPSPLNKRSELMSKCRHRAKFLLSSFSWYCTSLLFSMLHVFYHFDVVKNPQFFVKKSAKSVFEYVCNWCDLCDRNIMFCK